MTYPTYHEPTIADEVTEQALPVGGSDPAGHLPRAALPMVPVGIATVREVPTLEAAPSSQAVVAAATVRIMGRSALRRRVHITATVAVWIGNSELQTTAHRAFRLPANTVWSLAYAGEIWASAEADGTVTWWSEMDAG
jgi:hypothetical protein